MKHCFISPAYMALTLALTAAGLGQAATLPPGAPAAAGSALLVNQTVPNINGARAYIVRLADEPAASYSGGVAGLAATKPAIGQRLNVTASTVQAYTTYLNNKQASVAAAVGGIRTLHRYTAVFNGFSATLTDAQVQQLQSMPGVVSVQPDSIRTLATSYTPVFLGIDKPAGLWTQLGGKGLAGEGVVIGVLDTGVMPENPAFADQVDASGTPVFSGGTLAYGPPPASWKGSCEVAPSFPAGTCNNKLIGARSFHAAFDAASGIDPSRDYLSPRDNNGHGTHTASTAGGNNGVATRLASGFAGGGKASGMAPRARLAVYKIGWLGSSSSSPGILGGDTIAAIDQAIKDGVNVLSYSISGSRTQIDPVDLAFMGATNAGVFVAAAAGNNGANAVFHGAPWLTTVAASTHNRLFQAQLTLGNGTTAMGGTFNISAVPRLPLVLASASGMPGVDPAVSSVCAPLSLDLSKVAGKIIVCDRGTFHVFLKSDEAVRAGAAAVILVNVPGGDTDVYDLAFPLPWLHVNADKRSAILAYAALPQAQASIGDAGPTVGPVVAPQLAIFSNFGPNLADPSILKPEVSAPGVSILAGYIPPFSQAAHDAVANGSMKQTPAWAFLSGTSMATPHVAGAAALLMQRHPTWSPSAIKSALMTTASDLKPGTAVPVITSFGQGAGQIDPTRAADPGLVYDTTALEYQQYGCYMGLLTPCPAGLKPIASEDLNQPAIVAPNMPGRQTLTRRVTNVGSSSSTYYPTASLPGFDVQVTPAFLTLMPGETKSFAVTLTTTTADPKKYQFGTLQWSDGTHTVRSPLVAKAILMSTPPVAIVKAAKKGSMLTTVGTGFDGPMKTTTSELKNTVVKVTGSWGRRIGGPSGPQTCGLTDGTDPSQFPVYQRFDVPAGTSTFYVAGPQPGDFPAGQFVWPVYAAVSERDPTVGYFLFSDGSSTTLSTVDEPLPGPWRVCVSGYVGDGSKDFQDVGMAVRVMLPGDDASWKLKAAGPSSAVINGTASIGISWEVPSTGEYFGVVDFLSNGRVAGETLVWITPGNSPQPAGKTPAVSSTTRIDFSQKPQSASTDMRK